MLERLLDTVPISQFLAEFYQRLPFASARSATELLPLGNWDAIGEILAQPEADLMVIRGGERWSGQQPSSLTEARELSAQGYTLLVRHAERHIQPLRAWADGFRRTLAGEVNIHLYCTPGSQFGFGWHYDAEEVFIVQTTGSKEYSLRKNTVNPWPVPQAIPANMRYEREIMPLMRCCLQAGDWLYIPSGYWHMGRANEEAISLAIGVMPITGVDVFDVLRGKVLDSLRWRQRLPVPAVQNGEPDSEMLDRCRPLFEELAEDAARMLRDPNFLREFVKQRYG